MLEQHSHFLPEEGFELALSLLAKDALSVLRRGEASCLSWPARFSLRARSNTIEYCPAAAGFLTSHDPNFGNDFFFSLSAMFDLGRGSIEGENEQCKEFSLVFFHGSMLNSVSSRLLRVWCCSLLWSEWQVHSYFLLSLKVHTSSKYSVCKLWPQFYESIDRKESKSYRSSLIIFALFNYPISSYNNITTWTWNCKKYLNQKNQINKFKAKHKKGN